MIFFLAVPAAALAAEHNSSRPNPLPRCPPEDASRHLLVFHSRGEGSHAFSDSMDNLGCVNFLRGEYLHANPDELQAFFSSSPGEWEKAVAGAIQRLIEQPSTAWDTYARSYGYADAEAYHTSRLRSLRQQLQESARDNERLGCPCTSRGTLVRMDWLDGSIHSSKSWRRREAEHAVDGLCPLLEEGVQPVFLVRADLMRLSLSTYGRFVDGEENNPQFTITKIERKEYDLDILEMAAWASVGRWRTTATIVRALRERCNVRAALHVYEAFEDADGPPEGMAEYLLPCCGGRASAFATRNQTTVRRAHTHRISDFVRNSDAVYFHFATAAYPSFASTLAEQGLELSEIDNIRELPAACAPSTARDS